MKEVGKGFEAGWSIVAIEREVELKSFIPGGWDGVVSE
jgi:hypothetical protein